MKRLSFRVGNILEKNILHIQLRFTDLKCFILVENPDCYFNSHKCGWKWHSDWQQSTDELNVDIPRMNKAGTQ